MVFPSHIYMYTHTRQKTTEIHWNLRFQIGLKMQQMLLLP